VANILYINEVVFSTNLILCDGLMVLHTV